MSKVLNLPAKNNANVGQSSAERRCSVFAYHQLSGGTVLLALMAGLMLTSAKTVSAELYLSSGFSFTQYDVLGEVYIPVSLRASSDRGSIGISSGWIGLENSPGAIDDTAVSARLYDLLSSDYCQCGLDVQGSVKIPTATLDMGSGEFDLQYGATLYRYSSSGTVYLSYDYRINGDSSTTAYPDYSIWSAGGIAHLNDTTALGVFYDLQEDEIPDSGARTITIFLGLAASDRLSIRPFFSNTKERPEGGSNTLGLYFDVTL